MSGMHPNVLALYATNPLFTPGGGDPATVENTTGSYSEDVNPGDTLVLPDEVIQVEANDGEVLNTINNPLYEDVVIDMYSLKSGIAYQRPQPTGQTISYRTGDDAWQVVNNPYNAAPSNPLYTQSLVDFFTLKHDNAFGNRYRFTNENGNLYADFTQAFQLSTSGDYIIDNLTGLGWGVGFTNFDVDWNTAIDNCNNLTELGYSDWYLPNCMEKISLHYFVRNFFNFKTVYKKSSIGNEHLSTTYVVDTNRPYWDYDRSDDLDIYRGLNKTQVADYTPIRQHF
jgi:hypothetical protein